MISRRGFVSVLSGLIAAPMVASASSLMKIRGVVMPQLDPMLESFMKFSFTPHFDRIDKSDWFHHEIAESEKQKILANYKYTMADSARHQIEEYHKTDPIYITHPDTREWSGNLVQDRGAWYKTSKGDPRLRAHLKAAFDLHRNG